LPAEPNGRHRLSPAPPVMRMPGATSTAPARTSDKADPAFCLTNSRRISVLDRASPRVPQAGPQGDPRWVRDYGAWTGLGLLTLWTVAALLGGYLVLRRRDA
jgi:hypothetical protein